MPDRSKLVTQPMLSFESLKTNGCATGAPESCRGCRRRRRGGHRGPPKATVLKHVDHSIGTDIEDLQDKGGVPGFEPYLDTRSYFDYHHTAADTLDKVEPEALRRHVAVLAVLLYALAELKEPLARLPMAP